jgi:hypothetical protein
MPPLGTVLMLSAAAILLLPFEIPKYWWAQMKQVARGCGF